MQLFSLTQALVGFGVCLFFKSLDQILVSWFRTPVRSNFGYIELLAKSCMNQKYVWVNIPT